MSEKLEAALEWLADGFVLTKLHGITRKGNCTCGGSCGKRAGKHPVYKDPHGEHAIRTPEQAEAEFGSGLFNLGLVTGTPNSLVVLDVDTDEGKQGQWSLEHLAAAHGWDDLTATRQHKTGGGGTQYLFSYKGPALKTALSTLGKPGNWKLGDPVPYPDLDFKAGDGGAFIVLPPSVSGKGLYEVLSDDPIQKAPSWLLKLCERQSDPEGREGTVKAPNAAYTAPPDAATAQRWDYYADCVVRDALEELKALQNSKTGWTMGIFKACCTVYEIANSPWNLLSVREAERMMRAALPRVTDGSDFDPTDPMGQAQRRTAGRGRPAP
jgi:hypothetical protein